MNAINALRQLVWDLSATSLVLPEIKRLCVLRDTLEADLGRTPAMWETGTGHGYVLATQAEIRLIDSQAVLVTDSETDTSEHGTFADIWENTESCPCHYPHKPEPTCLVCQTLLAEGTI